MIGTKKRLFSLLFIFLLVQVIIMMIPTTASAANEVAGNPLKELTYPPVGNETEGRPREKQIHQLTQNCYIDGVDPFVERIEVKVSMEDNFAGPGDKLTFEVTFNEHLIADGKYVSGFIGSMMAELNVKDGNGNPVRLYAYNVETPAPYFIITPNPSYKDRKTRVTFEPLTVNANMVSANSDPEDTQIRIERIIINGRTFTDMMGNVYDGSVDPIKNTAKIYLDTEGSEITTNAAKLGDSYVPIPKEWDEKGNTIQFYFPVTISDKSGVNGLNGSFSWTNGIQESEESETAVYKYEYAVTASEVPPTDPGDWSEGDMGQLYTFEQVASGNYIHIRLFADEDYNIGSSAIKIIAQDNAGNTAKASFNLDYSMDNGKPSASLVKTEKQYVYGTSTGTLTAEVRANDNNSGLKEIYYLWVDSGSDEPDDGHPGWMQVGGFAPGIKTFSFYPNKEGIQGESYSGELYVKVRDVAGNERIVYLGSHTYNISAPKYTREYSGIRQTEATLNISEITSGSAIVVMIKNPAPDDIYFVSIIDDDNYSGGDILNNQHFEANVLNDVFSWKVYRVNKAENGKQYDFEYVGSPYYLNSGPQNYYTTLDRIINGRYYGDIEITLLAGESPLEPAQFEGYIGEPEYKESGAFRYLIDRSKTYDALLVQAGTESGPVYEEKFTLKAASDYDLNAYSTTITTSDVLDKLIEYRNNAMPLDEMPFNPDNESDRMLSTLEGVRINVSIYNNLVPGWGIEDIDFSNTYISVIRETDETLVGHDGKEYARAYLRPQATQTVVLPKAKEEYPDGYPSGRYKLKLIITAATSKKTYEFDFENFTMDGTGNMHGGIFVDNSKAATQFGFAGYAYAFQNGEYGINVRETRYYGPVNGATTKDEDGNKIPVTEYFASGNTIYIPVHSTDKGFDLPSYVLYFTVDDLPDKNIGEYESVEIIGARAIKAWNATEGVDANESKARALWYNALDATDDYNSRNSCYIVKFVDDASQVPDAYGISGQFGYLPLIKDKLNIVNIQVLNANGIVSKVQTVYIYPVAAEVSGTVSITDTNKPVIEGKLTFKPAPGQPMQDVKSIYVYDRMTGQLEDIIDNYDFYDNSYSLALTEPGFHLYYMYAVDSYGKYTLLGSKEWDYTDEGAPVLISSSIENEANGYFTARYEFSETSWMYGMEQTLKLYFNEDYMNLLGVGGNTTGEGFTLTLSKEIIQNAGNNFKAVYEPTTSNQYGIYKIEAEWKQFVTENRTYERLYVTVHGVTRYDGSRDEDVNVSHTLYATLTDPFGYVSNPGGGLVVEGTNTRPGYVDGYVYDEINGITTLRRFDAEFNTPVRLDKSLAKDNPSPYSDIKRGELPIFKDGKHTISFYDIFGMKWTQEIEVKDQFNEYGMQIYLSETGATSGPLEVTIALENNNDNYGMVYGPYNNFIEYDGIPFSIDSNTRLEVVIANSKTDTRVQQTLYITNILTGEPRATLHWYYHEFNSDSVPEGVTETSQPVTVSYTADRDVTPSGGTSASHTFYPGDSTTSYTFEFMDAAGNKGSITATLPISITEPEGQITDEIPPKYEILIYAMKDGKNEYRGYFDPGTGALEEVIRNAGYVQGYSFEISVTEDSPYKLILLEGIAPDTDINSVSFDGSVSDEVDGVTLYRNVITVTKNAVFTVVIVDKAGNRSSFIMELGEYLDKTPPKATVNTVYKDFNTVRLYIKLFDPIADDENLVTGNVKLLSPAWLKVEDNDPDYLGQYYYDFTENDSLTVTFMDMAGNKGSAIIEVKSLDMNPPVSSVKWSPHYVDSDGTPDTSLPTSNPTNKDITAIVTYDKPVNVSLFTYDGGQWIKVNDNTYDEYFTLKATSETATITFHKGGINVKLAATALNGKTTEDYLYLDDVIIKRAPEIDVKVKYNYREGYESGTPISATITLTPKDIDVYCAENPTPNKAISKGDSISFTVYEKGSYTYHFTDIAGNRANVTASVNEDFDRTPPVISVDTGDGTITGGTVTVTITLNESGTLTVKGADNTAVFSGSVSKGQRKEISIMNNGSYDVIAFDRAGNKATTVFMVGNIDKTPPVISFEQVTLDIRQDSREADLQAMLNSGYVVTDNVSSISRINVEKDTSGVNLSVPGVYNVVYTAEDEAGNTAYATRFVRVYSKYELEVLINGIKTYNGGTVAVDSNNMTISVVNPLGDEPYTIYLNKGFYTEGQMKYFYSILRPDANGRFSVTSKGFYTLYIVTQSRQTYLINIYVAKEVQQ